jgi:transcriptional regulator with XRE-family HTH domain
MSAHCLRCQQPNAPDVNIFKPVLLALGAVSDRPQFHKGFARYLIDLRDKRKGWSQSDIPRYSKGAVSRQQVLMLEAAKVADPDPDVLKSLAELYDEPYTEMLSRLIAEKYGVTFAQMERAASRAETDRRTIEHLATENANLTNENVVLHHRVSQAQELLAGLRGKRATPQKQAAEPRRRSNQK